MLNGNIETDYSSTSSTRAVKSLFTGVVPGALADAGSADVVVAEGVASWAVLALVVDVGAGFDFLLFFFFLLCSAR